MLDTAKIEQWTALKGTLNEEEGVFKVTSPRTDVKISVDQWTMPPFMGLTSWAAFQGGKKAEAMVMGDLVLFEDEVNPVMSALLDAGVSVTALHNHFFFDQPRVLFMHIGGEGDLEILATGVRKALAKVKEVRSASPTPGASFNVLPIAATNSIPAKDIEEILGAKGQSKDGMFKAVIGRKVKMSCGCEIGKEMGINTWAAFAGTEEKAVVDGDFIMFEGELQPVLKALRRGNINVVAIHNHMEGESPKAIFLHYWGKGAAKDLARGVRLAIDAQAAAAKSSQLK